MKAIVAFLKAVASGTSLAYTQLLKSFFMTLVFALVLTVIMWLLNIAGLKEANYFFFFIGGLIVFFVGLNPVAMIASVIYGGIKGGVEKKGIIRGAAEGPLRLLHFTIGIMYTFFCISGVLATTSFKESPSSFFAILSMVTLFCTASAFYSNGIGKLGRGLITLYALFVCVCAFWSIIPVNTKSNLGMSGNVILRIDNVIGSGKERVKNQINMIVVEESTKVEKAIREKNLKERSISDSIRTAHQKIESNRIIAEQEADSKEKLAREKKELEDKLDKLLQNN